ncbi:MAG: hypothetical protein AAF620_01285 [Bacteroidota bacterium]
MSNEHQNINGNAAARQLTLLAIVTAIGMGIFGAIVTAATAENSTSRNILLFLLMLLETGCIVWFYTILRKARRLDPDL